MTVKRLLVIISVMLSGRLYGEYKIYLEPDAAKRRTVTIFCGQGPETASLYLYAPTPWVIGGSAITTQDDILWRGINRTPNSPCHIYQMVQAQSSQQNVIVFGELTKLGSGFGSNPWFKATVPAVDMDWEKHSGAGHEDDEDSWVGYCPFATNNAGRTAIIVRKPKDDRSLVTPSMTLECWPTGAVRFLKEDGVTALWSGATISDSQTPLTLYVDPQQAGPFTVTISGQMDDNFNRPTDYLKGTSIKVELKSVVFTSDHKVLTDYNSNFADAGGECYNPQGWVKGGANNPISHTRYQNASVNVVVCAQPSGVNLLLAGTGAVPGLSFSSTAFVSTGLDQSISLTSSQPFLRMVNILNESVAWNVVLPSGVSSSIGSSGPHKIYVTCGNPGAGPTKKRINWVCTKAVYCGNEDHCADAIWDGVATETWFYSGNGQWDDWHLLDGWNIFQGGDCDNQARCMSSAVGMLGIDNALVAYVCASTNAGAGNCLSQDTRFCTVHAVDETLILDFPTSGLNEYEGCCSAAGGFYAITPKKKATDDYQMLKKLGTEDGITQVWCFRNQFGEPAPCDQPGSRPPIP